jgi:hypothetical protein
MPQEAVNSTVANALAAANVSLMGNERVYVAGVEASHADILDDNDILAIVTPKQAGA